MSQSSAVRATGVRLPTRHARPVARPVPAPPRLRIVAAPAHTRSQVGIGIVCGTLLVGGLVTLLLVQMSLERGAYALQHAQSQARVLGEQQQALQEELARVQAPQNLAAHARLLGMVPARQPVFLRVPDGKVLGVPAPGIAPPSPTVVKPAATTRPTAAAQPKVPAPSKAATPSKVATPRKPAAQPPAEVGGTAATGTKSGTTRGATTTATSKPTH